MCCCGRRLLWPWWICDSRHLGQDLLTLVGKGASHQLKPSRRMKGIANKKMRTRNVNTPAQFGAATRAPPRRAKMRVNKVGLGYGEPCDLRSAAPPYCVIYFCLRYVNDITLPYSSSLVSIESPKILPLKGRSASRLPQH